VGQRLVFVVLWVKGGDAREGGGRLGGLREIFVALEANRYSDFRFSRRRVGCGRRPDYSQDTAAAAYGHALAQSDLGGHAEGELDLGTFTERRVGEEEDSARTEILGESDAFEGSLGLTKREWKKVGESLSGTAFNLNWRSGHGGASRPFPHRGSAGVTVAHGGE
jgi:hypothetical protein